MTVGDRDGVQMSAGGVEPRTRIRWMAVLAVFALGAVLVGLGVVADVRWGWSNIWPSVFLELGAGVGLAGVLFALERTFARTIRMQTRQEVEAAVGRGTAALRTQLGSLQDELRDALAKRHAAQDAAFAGLDEPTATTVADAVRAGSQLHTLDPRFRVRASADPNGYRLRIDGLDDPRSGPLTLVLWAPTTKLRSLKSELHEDRPLHDIVNHLAGEIERHHPNPPDVFDPDYALRCLRDDLQFAAQVARRSSPATMDGLLIERFSDDILLTHKGIEHPPGTVVVTRRAVLERDSGLQGVTRAPWEEPPDGVDAELWRCVLQVASATYSLR